MLPAIYSYVNERNEKILKEHYNGAIEEIESKSIELETRYQELIIQNEILKKELGYFRKRKDLLQKLQKENQARNIKPLKKH